MTYRRFQHKETKYGIFSEPTLLDDIRNKVTPEEVKLWEELNKDLIPTERMPRLMLSNAKHFFTNDFWNKHNNILEKIKSLVSVIDDLEYLEVKPEEIKRNYFEDEQQVIIEL